MIMTRRLPKSKTIYQRELNKLHNSYVIMRNYARDSDNRRTISSLKILNNVLEMLDYELDPRIMEN